MKSELSANLMLDRLPFAEWERMIGLMEWVSLQLNDVVSHPDKEPAHVHFPISAVLSSMVPLEDASLIEASTVGNEGMDGLYLLADPLANPYRINVQVGGDALRMSAKALRLMLARREQTVKFTIDEIRHGAHPVGGAKRCVHLA